jgi:hypothetical protein
VPLDRLETYLAMDAAEMELKLLKHIYCVDAQEGLADGQSVSPSRSGSEYIFCDDPLDLG